MISQESLKLAGKLNIVVTGEDGQVKDTREVNNLVVQAGLRYITERMASNTPTTMTHLGIGNGGATDTADDQTDLQGTEKNRFALFSTTANNNPATGRGNIVYVCNLGTGNNIPSGAITEAGIFNAASSGTMLCRTKFDVINKGANDTMTITWTITLDAV